MLSVVGIARPPEGLDDGILVLLGERSLRAPALESAEKAASEPRHRLKKALDRLGEDIENAEDSEAGGNDRQVGHPRVKAPLQREPAGETGREREQREHDVEQARLGGHRLGPADIWRFRGCLGARDYRLVLLTAQD